MSDTPQGPGWWLASDGRFYPPEQAQTPPPPPPAAPAGFEATAGSPQGPQQPATTSKNPSKKMIAILGIGAVLAAAATLTGAVIFLGGGGDPTVPGPEALGVSFTLVSFDSEDIGGTQGSCYGFGGYDDFGAGMDIRVMDQDGKLIGSGATQSLSDLARSEPDFFDEIKGEDFNPEEDIAVGCQVAALVPLLGDADIYRVEIGRRGETTYTRTDLEEAGWKLDLSLGL